MEEWDVVKSIFLEKMNCNESVANAIIAESQNNWQTAKINYKNLIDNDISLERRDFYYESYFKCFAHLGDWDHIPAAICSVIEAADEKTCWPMLFDRGFNQQKLLPWYITSKVNNILSGQSDWRQFSESINDSLRNADQSDYLKAYFSDELAVLWLHENDVNTAKQYLRNYIDEFLSNWQLLNPMFSNVRFSKLLKLRNIIDINKFTNVFSNLNIDYEETIDSLQKYWYKNSNEILPSITFNETRILYRVQFVKLLIDKVRSFYDGDTSVNNLQEAKYKFYLDMVDIANNEKNYYMCKKYLAKCQDENISDKLKCHLHLAVASVSHLKADLATNKDDKLTRILQSLNILGTEIPT